MPWMIIGATAAVAGVLTGTFLYGVSVGVDRAAVRQRTMEQVAAEAVRQRDLKMADVLAQIEVKNVEITQPVIREVRTRIQYRECKHDPAGLRAVNDAITGRPQPPSGGSVPPAGPARP